MKSCAACGTTIVFGGVEEDDRPYCNESCAEQGLLLEQATSVPEAELRRAVEKVHEGPCPLCSGAGPVDVHKSYRVWSGIVITAWSTRQTIGCRRCGVKQQLLDILYSGLCGWWGRLGVILTPIQIARNITALISPPSPYSPSEELERSVRLQLARNPEILRRAA